MQIILNVSKITTLLSVLAMALILIHMNRLVMYFTDTILHSIYYTIEESLGMFGVIYLIWILLNLLEGKTLEVNATK